MATLIWTPSGRPGLGAHAHAEFGIPVIGVAKSRFRTATHAVPVKRGSSVRPLFVTAAGMPPTDAADLVRRIAGRYVMSPDRRSRRRQSGRRPVIRQVRTRPSSDDAHEVAFWGSYEG